MKKIAFMLCMLISISVWAQENETKQELKNGASPQLTSLKLATDLIRYGYEQQSAISLINALEIIASTSIEELDAEAIGNKVSTENKEKQSTMTLDCTTLLADAKRFADGDNALLAMVDEVEQLCNISTRGAVGGPKQTQGAVLAKDSHLYHIKFYGTYLAEVLVSGDGDTDLDLYIYDENGNLIVSDTDYTDECYVNWIPAWTGSYVVKIVNRGNVYNRYVIMTN